MRPFKSSVLLAALVLFFGWTWTQLFGNVGISVQAADDGAFAPLSSDFAGGSGTEEAPYIIETAEQLNKVRDGPLSIDWTARIEKIMQLDRTFVRIEQV